MNYKQLGVIGAAVSLFGVTVYASKRYIDKSIEADLNKSDHTEILIKSGASNDPLKNLETLL